MVNEKTPTIDNRAELVRIARTLTGSRNGIEGRRKIPRLAGMTSILDILDQLRAVSSKGEFQRLQARHKEFFELATDPGSAGKLAQLKANPVLAAIADERGEVVVEGETFDVFEPDGARAITGLMATDPDTDPGTGTGGPTSSGYVFTELPPEWMVESLPCGPWTVLPGYPTRFFETSIGGRNVLVQLWKGSCPDYLGQGAGGVGAEVGLYNRDPWLPETFWWPDHEHKKLISFTLNNPKTNVLLFSAGSTTPIWWLHKWMKFPSYDQYVRDQNGNVPGTTAGYVLRYKIDGRSFSW